MRKTYFYTQKTINEFSRIKSNIQNEIKARYLSGARKFIISGSGELADLAEMAIKNLKYGDIVYKRKKEKSSEVLIAGGEKLPLMSPAAKL